MTLDELQTLAAEHYMETGKHLERVVVSPSDYLALAKEAYGFCRYEDSHRSEFKEPLELYSHVGSGVVKIVKGPA